MTEIQQKCLSILKWYHNFCVQHHLTYYIMAGTLLGAVRHKGFIPWDDDIDVTMPRKDYEKFISLTKNIASVYRVESCNSGNEKYYFPFTKIYDTRTTWIEKGYIPIVGGIFIDIFPLDRMSNWALLRKLQYFVIHFLCSCKANCLRRTKKKRSRALLLFLSFIRKYFSSYFISRNCSLLINKLCSYSTLTQANFLAALIWGSKKQIVPAAYYGTPKLYPFEGLSVYGPEHGDLLLTAVYGDYMTLPPLEERVPPHPPDLLDMHTSYLQRKIPS